MQRRHESLMSGAEIAQTFKDTEVQKLEEQQAAIEMELETIHAQLDASEEAEEQEELRMRSQDLREQSRLLLAKMRVLQKKFSESIGFNLKSK